MQNTESHGSINKSMIAGTFIALAGAGLWGLNAVVSKYLMARGIDTMWMVNFRMFSSGVVLLLAGIVREKGRLFDIWKDRRSVIRLLAIAVLAFGVCQLTYYLSISFSNAGIASALQQTAPVFVLVYVMTREHRLPAAAEAVTIPLVVFGSFLIATHGDIHALAIHPAALASGLISAMMSALYMTLPGPLIRRYGTLSTVGWGLTLGGCFLAPFCRMWNFPEAGAVDGAVIAGLIFIIIPGAAMAFGLFLYGTSIVGPVRGGVYNLFEPVTAVTASALFLGQSFHITEIFGIACILGGIAILTVAKGERSDGQRQTG